MPVQPVALQSLPTRIHDPFTELTYTQLMDTGPGNGACVAAVDMTGLQLHKLYFKNPTTNDATITIRVVGSTEVDAYYGRGNSGLSDETKELPPGAIREWAPNGIFVQVSTSIENPNPNAGTIIIESDQLIEIAAVRLWVNNL